MKKIKCYEYSPCRPIHKASLSSQITNVPNKLEYYITID
jgi:hypothetical protein